MRSETDAKRAEMELMMRTERVTLSPDQGSDNAVQSDNNGGKVDIRHLLPRMLYAADFDCFSFFHILEVTFNLNGDAKCMWPNILPALLSSRAQKWYDHLKLDEVTD